MGSGTIQLLSRGKQDGFLIGNPQMTHFRKVFKRHTPFAIEHQEILFDNMPEFGGKSVATMPLVADAVTHCYMRIQLPAMMYNGSSVSWLNHSAYALIKKVSVEIGGCVIDEYTGNELHVMHQLTTKESKKEGMMAMTGEYVYYSQMVQNKGPLTLYLPLPFWFSRDASQALPLCALRNQEVTISVTLHELEEMFDPTILKNTPYFQPDTTVEVTQCQLFGHFITLGKEEKQQFVSKPIDYLIDQVQRVSTHMIDASTSSSMISLPFTFPTKTLLWWVQSADRLAVNDRFTYSVPSAEDDSHEVDALSTCRILMNGVERLDTQPAAYYRMIQPYYHTDVIPTNTFVYQYAFGLKPFGSTPSGHANLSIIDTTQLEVVKSEDAQGKQLSVHVMSICHNILHIEQGRASLRFIV